MTTAGRWLLLCCAALLAAGSHAAAATSKNAIPTNAAVRAMGEGRFQVGKVQIDKSGHAVSFPAVVNLLGETVEYALVHNTGKVHESVFRTETRPQEVHVAMLLLGVNPALTNQFPEDLSIAPPGDPVEIEVAWTNDGKRVSRPIEDYVLNRQTGKSLERGVWIYNGSNFSEGAFTAQRDGSIISIHIDPDALINNPRPGREDDDLHAGNVVELPPLNTPVEIIVRLKSAPPAKSSP